MEEITRERVLRELEAIAFADILDYSELMEGEDGEYRVLLKPTAELSPIQRAAIVSIKQSRTGIEIKLADKLSALEKLGRHVGIFEKRDSEEIEDLSAAREEVFGDELEGDR